MMGRRSTGPAQPNRSNLPAKFQGLTGLTRTHDAATAPLSVYMLADHLDAVLAAGEDLVVRGQAWQALYEDRSEPSAFAERQRSIAESVRALELMIVVRVLKARDHARDLAEVDSRFRAVANLYVSGTNVLLDAVAECGDARGDDFDTGDELISYIRSRGLIAPDAATVETAAQVSIDDSFLIAKRIALGPLLDMSAAFLDALETFYDLFAVEDDEAGPEAEAGPPNRPFGRRPSLPVN